MTLAALRMEAKALKLENSSPNHHRLGQHLVYSDNLLAIDLQDFAFLLIIRVTSSGFRF
jgi:hypothetical protein